MVCQANHPASQRQTSKFNGGESIKGILGEVILYEGTRIRTQIKKGFLETKF